MNEQHKGVTLWLTGLPCSGKSTLAGIVAQVLARRCHPIEVLDGDDVRRHLSMDLGFSKADRDQQIRRIGFLCRLLSKHGVVAIAAAISPFRATRDEVRASMPRFVEVYVKASIEICIQRDVKGLYSKALQGKIEKFTGVSDPYEPPLNPELVDDTETETPYASAAHILIKLEQMGPVVLAQEVI